MYNLIESTAVCQDFIDCKQLCQANVNSTTSATLLCTLAVTKNESTLCQ